jgi:(E)-4-hydroxy-3-methyl-but-2-enyl pyrophosphate reductase
MKVIKTKNAGFCFGVRRAVEASEKLASEEKKIIYTYGKLIHNDQEVERLKKNGIIPKDVVADLKDQQIIIRTHGVSKKEIEALEKNNNVIIDYTCPFVKKLQSHAKEYYEQGYQVLIFGQSDHPEISGVKGWTDNTAIIIDGPATVQNIDFTTKKVCLLVQTTEKEEQFSLISEILKTKVPDAVIINTICHATQQRQDETRALAKEVDVMIVVGGKESSNTKKLFQVAKSVNNNTFIIEKALDLDKKWFETSNVVGVSAGASTPDWIIEEVIKEMEEKKETIEMAEAVESKKSPKKGAIVQGKVVQVEADRAFVAVGGKTEAILEPSEVSFRNLEDLTTAINVGDEFMVKVIDIENDNGEIRVSKRRAEEKEAIEKLLEAKENHAIIKAEVYEAVKGGILVDVGIRGFIPASLVDVGYIEDLNQFVGQEIEVMVEEVDLENRKYILSRKAVIDKGLEKVWEELEEGTTKKGIVKKLVDFGAFIDLGGIEGLLHISEMGWGKVEKSSDVLEEGQEIDVYLLSVNKETNKIALSLKKLKADPWSVVEKNYNVGDVLTGKVVRDAHFGAFVEIEPGLDGLVHISQIDWERVEKVSDALTLGDEVQVKILEIDAANKKLNLSIKETLDRPQRVERPRREEKAPEQKKFAEKKEFKKPRTDRKPARSEAETETIMDDQGPTGVNIGELFGDKLKDFMK